MNANSHSILVSDFDGTITQFDFYDLVCKEFPDISSHGYWQKYEAGEITHFEALRLIFASIRAPYEKIAKILTDMKIDANLKKTAADLRDHNWQITVVSAGCCWYIDKLLSQADVSFTVHSNPGEYYPEQGLVMRLPKESPFFSQDLGINKVAVVKDALSRSKNVAFAGDGRPDLPAALLVPPERRFARYWLAKKLHEIGENFHPFETWSDIAKILLKEETHVK